MVKGTKPVAENGDPAVSTGGQEFIISDIRISSFLTNCRPEPYVKCYIHVILMDPEYEIPLEDRKQAFHALMASNQCLFGVLTRTPLPKICSFPVWSDLGQTRIHLSNNHLSYTFSNAQLMVVQEFHKFLFTDIVAKVKKCFLFDAESSNSFYIIPLKKKNCDDITIAWSVMRDKIGLNLDPPTKIEEYSDESYNFKVVTPWYRDQNDIPLFYVITNTNTGLYMHSKMDLRNETFSDYFNKRYKLQAKQKDVPLFEARMITNILESVRPRPITSSAKLKRRKKRDFQTFFHPEFVTKQKFPAIYWYKATLLPSILHRMKNILLAEELRETIVKEARVGNLDIQIDPAIEYLYFLEAEKMENNQMDTMEDQSENKHPSSQNNADNSQEDGLGQQDPPHLSTFEDNSLYGGPSHYDILQALTLLGANDTICMERLETLGDCFLKFITSFSIFVRHPNMKEGEMTRQRSLLIGNNNLTTCGMKCKIPGCIQVSKFLADSTWIAPSFSVPAEICDIILQPSLNCVEFPFIIRSEGRDELLRSRNLLQLLKICLPQEERLKGSVSASTLDAVRDQFMSRANGNKDEITAALYCIGKQELSVKNVADTVEALVGIYLQKCGIHGAFRVAKYFGIIEDENLEFLMNIRIPSVVPPDKMDAVKKMLPQYSRIEKILDYQFQDKALLLEVFTPASCPTNDLTDCYQRLEFVGDAVLDFLVTSYIYEYCGDLNPGQITDLRSALVNNIMFGALLVRLGLHEFLLDPAEPVGDAVAAFASFQESKNHEIFGNELMIVKKGVGNVTIAEEVQAPKILADVFEALAGAIFIDSGYNLKLLWKIYYNIMKDEIAQFKRNIPLNPVRVLIEKDPNVVFESIGKAYGDEVMKATVHVKGKIKEFFGKGRNSTCAKRAVAKLALKSIGHSEYVI